MALSSHGAHHTKLGGQRHPIAWLFLCPFAKVKIMVDTTLVLLAVAGCYLFFGRWQWNVVGVGTLFAMIYVGLVVRFTSPHLAWFDRLLAYVPGFRRYLFGLARWLYRRGSGSEK